MSRDSSQQHFRCRIKLVARPGNCSGASMTLSVMVVLSTTCIVSAVTAASRALGHLPVDQPGAGARATPAPPPSTELLRGNGRPRKLSWKWHRKRPAFFLSARILGNTCKQPPVETALSALPFRVRARDTGRVTLACYNRNSVLLASLQSTG